MLHFRNKISSNTDKDTEMHEATKTEKARNAFEKGDKDLSIAVHQTGKLKEPHSGEAGEFISSIVFGGLDGIITTFAVVAAATASHLTRGLILIIGFANLIGDAIGMAVGDYVSTKAETDHLKAERKREQWEMENCLDMEKQEMVDIYQRKGLSQDEAVEVVNLLLENPKVFLDTMMVEELGLLSGGEEENLIKGAAVTFAAFMGFGGLPMLAFLFSGDYTVRGGFDSVFIASVCLFATALFTLGALRGYISKRRWYVTGFTMLLNGAVTTAIAYAFGNLLEQYI